MSAEGIRFVHPSAQPSDDTPPDEDELEGSPSDPSSNDPDIAPFIAKFKDLPSIRQASERMMQAGYHQDDPMFMLIEVLSLYDRRQEVLVSRQIQMVTKMHQTLEAATAEIAAVRGQLEEHMAAIEDNQDSAQTLGQQFSQVLRCMADYTPFLERAGREVRGAAELIENRSTKAIILSYLSPAITLIAGVVIGMMLR